MAKLKITAELKDKEIIENWDVSNTFLYSIFAHFIFYRVHGQNDIFDFLRSNKKITCTINLKEE